MPSRLAGRSAEGTPEPVAHEQGLCPGRRCRGSRGRRAALRRRAASAVSSMTVASPSWPGSDPAACCTRLETPSVRSWSMRRAVGGLPAVAARGRGGHRPGQDRGKERGRGWRSRPVLKGSRGCGRSIRNLSREGPRPVSRAASSSYLEERGWSCLERIQRRLAGLMTSPCADRSRGAARGAAPGLRTVGQAGPSHGSAGGPAAGTWRSQALLRRSITSGERGPGSRLPGESGLMPPTGGPENGPTGAGPANQ